MPKKKYLVGVREVHVSTREVLASSPEEAIALAGENPGDELNLEYSHTMDKEFWTVEEAEDDLQS